MTHGDFVSESCGVRTSVRGSPDREICRWMDAFYVVVGMAWPGCVEGGFCEEVV